MFRKQPTKILAIDPGLRFMGIALLDDGELIYQGVKTIDKSKSPSSTIEEGRKIIHRLLDDFQPQVLVYEQSYFRKNQTAALLNEFVDEIRLIGKRRRLKVIGIAPRELKKAICGNGNAKKQEVATVVISRYPGLKVYLPQAQQWKERYWLNLFDAVALAMVAMAKYLQK